METTAEQLRHLTIEGCYNLRDIGGYTTADGRRTRWRVLLRSDSPHRLTPEGWRSLHGLRTIIDLRRPAELVRYNYKIATDSSARYQHMPIFDDQDYNVVDAPAQDLDELYRLLLDQRATQFAAVLRAIGADGAAPALIHCAVGKDRTGLVIALALSIAGVPRSTIAADYAMSRELLSPLYEGWRAELRERGGDVERLERMLETRQENMLRTLEYLDARYGGVESYLAQAGLTEPEIKRLNEMLVEPA